MLDKLIQEIDKDPSVLNWTISRYPAHLNIPAQLRASDERGNFYAATVTAGTRDRIVVNAVAYSDAPAGAVGAAWRKFRHIKERA